MPYDGEKIIKNLFPSQIKVTVFKAGILSYGKSSSTSNGGVRLGLSISTPFANTSTSPVGSLGLIVLGQLPAY